MPRDHDLSREREQSPPAVRPPAVAGMFYPADPAQCRRWARQLVQGGDEETPEISGPAATNAGASDAGGINVAAIDAGTTDRGTAANPGARGAASRWFGAVVPHAGWVASGAIAGEALRTLAAAAPRPPDLVVVFGAVHTPIDLPLAALDSHARWAVPGGESTVARELADRLAGDSELFAVDDRLHAREHAVEVELPLIQALWPGAEVLPVEVPLVDDAAEIGRDAAIAGEIARHESVVFLASSDLTHYGPAYRFAPAGVGPQGLAWAKDNDRRLLDLVAAMEVDKVVPEVRRRSNACGGGAIAAMLAACRHLGATRATVLRHANSFETLAPVAPQPPVDAVGYAAVVVG